MMAGDMSLLCGVLALGGCSFGEAHEWGAAPSSEAAVDDDESTVLLPKIKA